MLKMTRDDLHDLMYDLLVSTTKLRADEVDDLIVDYLEDIEHQLIDFELDEEEDDFDV